MSASGTGCGVARRAGVSAARVTRMTELRTEIFGKDFPASAAITVAGFARPEMMIEIQGVAVTG